MKLIHWLLRQAGYRSHYLVTYAFSIENGRSHGSGHIDIDVPGWMRKKDLKEVINLIAKTNNSGAEYAITNIRRWWL